MLSADYPLTITQTLWAYNGRVVKYFDANTHKSIAYWLMTHDVVATDMQHRGVDRKLAVATNNGMVLILTPTESDNIHRITLSGTATCVKYNYRCTILAVAIDDYVVLYDVPLYSELRTLHHHTALITSLAFSNHDLFLVTTSNDRTAAIWHPSAGAVAEVLKTHKEKVLLSAFSPNDGLMATVGADYMVLTWRFESFNVLSKLKHECEVTKVEFSNNSHTIMTMTAQCITRLWDVRTGAVLRLFDMQYDVTQLWYRVETDTIIFARELSAADLASVPLRVLPRKSTDPTVKSSSGLEPWWQ